MRHLFYLLIMSALISLSVHAQKKTFLRFYDHSGYKFEKGVFVAATDSSIVVSRDITLIEIPISRIYSIKTKRSYGHKALVSSILLGIPLTIYAASTGEPEPNDHLFSFTPGEAAILGVLGGIVGGAITGAILSGNSKTFIIDGDIRKWKKFRSIIIPNWNLKFEIPPGA